MLSHFVIEYIQDETYLKLGYFWRYKYNPRGHQLLWYYNIFTGHQDVIFPFRL